MPKEKYDPWAVARSADPANQVQGKVGLPIAR